MEGGDLSLENYKFSFIPKKKNWYELPSRSNPPPPQLELSGSANACLTVEFYFVSSYFHVTGLAIRLSSADAQADLRLCRSHATKSSFSQQGTYGMG